MSGWEQGVGITLALISGVFIGASVVFTKKALLMMKNDGHNVASGSREYLKKPVWWVGMTLTALGELSNFGAYAFVPAILVTPLGAISVVISISSLGGSYLVLAAQGFGTSFVYSVRNWDTDNQFKQWPIYPLFAFLVFFVIFQVNFLNKALSCFSAAVVTPIYYVFFTTATMLTSAFLFQGFPVGSTVDGVSILFGFLVICGGVALLFQYSLKLQRIAKEAGQTVARIANRASINIGSERGGSGMGAPRDAPLPALPASVLSRHDARSESDGDVTSIIGGKDTDIVVKYPSSVRYIDAQQQRENNANSLETLTLDRMKFSARKSSLQYDSVNMSPAESLTHPRPIRPSFVIDGDGVDESDEVTSISHAVVPGLKLVKMIGATTRHLEKEPPTTPPHRSISLTVDHDRNMLSWIRRRSTQSTQSTEIDDIRLSSAQRVHSSNSHHQAEEIHPPLNSPTNSKLNSLGRIESKAAHVVISKLPEDSLKERESTLSFEASPHDRMSTERFAELSTEITRKIE
ncbi:hypothetical protein HK100_000224 [Physocladia obscura]|uniref:DUF803-domain-containing protein n=1 Tax=Physocladia obscura TaxID=109957 RepID=A0AAD5XLT2_9FUNG|nr:hypothetical protein HK100_000224 [Physocladia obscura]